MRLNKYLSSSGIDSRRKCDVLISGGHVTVNGKIVMEPGFYVSPEEDIIKIDNKICKAGNYKKLYYKFYKPYGCISSVSDNRGRVTVIDYFKKTKNWTTLFPVGRLDYDSEGLIFVTNDGEFSNKVIHPSNRKLKVYLLKIKGRPDKTKLLRLKKGINMGGKTIKIENFRIKKELKSNTIIEIKILTGQNRIVKKMFSKIKYPVLKLKRTAIGKIKLTGLTPGQFLPLNKKERELLKT